MTAEISEGGKTVEMEVTVNEAKTKEAVNLFIAFYDEDGRLVNLKSASRPVAAAMGGKLYHNADIPSGAEKVKVMIMSPDLYPYLQAIPMNLVQ